MKEIKEREKKFKEQKEHDSQPKGSLYHLLPTYLTSYRSVVQAKEVSAAKINFEKCHQEQ